MPHKRTNKINLRVWSMFTHTGDIDKKGKLNIHWEGNKSKPGEPTAENAIEGASFVILRQYQPLFPKTDKTGLAVLDLKGLPDGFHTLRINPPDGQVSNTSGGVYLEPGAALRTYRPLDIQFAWKNKGISGTPKPAIADSSSKPINGAVVHWDENELTIDWKPDWVRAKKIHARGYAATEKSGAQDEFKPKCIVLHRTFEDTIGSSLNQFLPTEINAHYLIDRDGFVVKCVHERDEASHAGAGAQWTGMRPLNAHAIGIEMVNKSGPMTEAQMKSLILLLKALREKYNIPQANVVGHCEVSPLERHGNEVVNNRLNCPGTEFDWQRLEREGLAARLQTPTSGNMDSLISRYPYFLGKPPVEPLKIGDSDAELQYGGKKPQDPKFRGMIISLQMVLNHLGYEHPVPENAAKVAPNPLPSGGKYDWATGRIVERFKARYLGTRDDEPNKPKINEFLDKVTAYTIMRAFYGRGLK
jgi:N-acetyl-anhydromuramyl-L-alanine amidase AmpD